MKTFDKKDVYSWANCEEVTINTWGYFGESLNDLKREIKEGQEHKLLSIDSEDSYCFKYVENDSRISCPFFLPADKVKEIQKEKTYRPFKNVDEFQQYYKVGYILHLKDKEDDTEEHTLITSIIFDKNEPCIVLGSYSNRGFTLDKLFEKYEVKQNGKYQPFGVLDES